MPVTFTAGNQAVSAKPIDLITSALIEIGRQSPGETVDPNVAAFGLEKLQRKIDQLNAAREAIFSQSFQLFNLIANHAPHTIGPTGDFNVPVRPVLIASASFVLNGTIANPVDMPIKIRDDQWWAAQPLKSLQNSIVTHLYYDPASPNGNINFWPVCNVAAPVRLEIWNSLPQAISLTTPLGMVQGYWDYIVLTLALSLCSPLQAAPSPVLVAEQKRAENIIFTNNSAPSRTDLTGGMPQSGNGGRPDFNWITGLRE